MNNDFYGHSARMLLSVILFIAAAASSAFAQGTGFTYQGRLQDSGTNANGLYDFQFTLWDALSGGVQQPQPSPITVTRSGVAVANGIFTVQLDFGASTFPGADRFLEIGVRPAGGSGLTILSPRQPITSTPYATRSASAGSADSATTATNATQLGGVAANQYVLTGDARLSDARPPTAGSSNYIQNTNLQQPSSNFSISGDGFIDGSAGVGTTSPVFLGSPARFTVQQRTSGQWTQHIGTNSFAAGNSFGLLIDAGTNGTDRPFRIRSQTGALDLFSIRGDGWVGLGTDNPQSLLHLRANSTVSNSLVIENLDVASRTIVLSNYGSAGAGNYWPGLNSSLTSSLLAPNLFVLRSTGGMVFSGSSTAEHMRITTSGNVGIGTPSPATPLHVNGRVLFQNGGNNGVRITPASDSDVGVLNVTNAANTVNWLTVGSGGQVVMNGTDVVMNGTGNVGIGTAAPTRKLHVVGDIRIGGGGVLYAGNLTSGGGDTACWFGVEPAFFLGRCASSLRYKTSVKPYADGLSLIRRLNPIRYDWKNDGKADFGLGAEDVEPIEPLLVTYNNGQVEGVKYDRIGVVLINAVKEQQAQIEAQQEQIKRQQKQIKRQEDQARQQRTAFAAQQQQLEGLKKLVCRSHRRAAICR